LREIFPGLFPPRCLKLKTRGKPWERGCLGAKGIMGFSRLLQKAHYRSFWTLTGWPGFTRSMPVYKDTITCLYLYLDLWLNNSNRSKSPLKFLGQAKSFKSTVTSNKKNRSRGRMAGKISGGNNVRNERGVSRGCP